jgi:hypothetical protein
METSFLLPERTKKSSFMEYLMLEFFTNPLCPSILPFPNDPSAQALLAVLSAAASSFHWFSFRSYFLLSSLTVLPTALLLYGSIYTYYYHCVALILP